VIRHETIASAFTNAAFATGTILLSLGEKLRCARDKACSGRAFVTPNFATEEYFIQSYVWNRPWDTPGVIFAPQRTLLHVRPQLCLASSTQTLPPCQLGPQIVDHTLGFWHFALAKFQNKYYDILQQDLRSAPPAHQNSPPSIPLPLSARFLSIIMITTMTKKLAWFKFTTFLLSQYGSTDRTPRGALTSFITFSRAGSRADFRVRIYGAYETPRYTAQVMS